jgi:outer membrane lipoprotein-sorting protein
MAGHGRHGGGVGGHAGLWEGAVSVRPLLVVMLWAAALGVPANDASAYPDEAAVTPEKILVEMARVYGGCRSYRDTGNVMTATLTEGGRAGSERPFATAFVRPNRFRFQFTDPGLGERSSRYIVWTDGTEVRSWWDAKPGVRRPASLQEALGIAAGISGGSSIRIPGLLLPKDVGQGAPLVGAERIEDGVDRGVPCVRIKGKSRKTPYSLTVGGRTLTVQDESVTLWIDRATFLLRKVEEAKTFDTYRSQSTTVYTAELNVEIPAAELDFNVPEGP